MLTEELTPEERNKIVDNQLAFDLAFWGMSIEYVDGGRFRIDPTKVKITYAKPAGEITLEMRKTIDEIENIINIKKL